MRLIELFREILAYPFLARAIVSGVLIALVSSLLGVSLVLKRYAMIGDGLSHVSFGAIALAMALGLAPLSVAIPLVLLASFLLLRLSDKSSIRGDSALAMISSSALAIGVIAVSWGQGSTDVYNYMFGKSATSSECGSSPSSPQSSLLFIFSFIRDCSRSPSTGLRESLACRPALQHAARGPDLGHHRARCASWARF